MPRTYQKKRVVQYSLEELQAAVASVKDGMSIYQAAKAYNVPESTIRNRIQQKTANEVKGPGRNQLIPKHIEDELASHIIFLSDIQQPLTRLEILNIVQEYFSTSKIKNPFSKVSGGPGREWLMNFLKRYPEIKDRKAQPLQKARAQCATVESFTKFFNMLKEHVGRLNITNAAQIINLDETGYSSSIGTKVLAKKGTRCVSQIQGGSGKETFSVVETIAGNGHVFPPCIIYKSKYLYHTWCLNGPEGAAYVSSDNGWHDKKTFQSYFAKFVEWTKDWKKPILVVYDGHNSHIQLSISKMAKENNIHILSLPAHSSDKIQPLDVAVFGPAKKVWMKVKREYSRRSSQKSINKEVFPSLLKEMREQGAFPAANIISGFRSSGIWPVSLEKAIAKLPPQPQSNTPTVAEETHRPTLAGRIDASVTASTPAVGLEVNDLPATEAQPVENIEFPVSSDNFQEQEEQLGLPSQSPVTHIALQDDISLPGTSGVQPNRPTTSSCNRNLYLDSCSTSPSSSGQVTPTTTPDSSFHQIDAFRKVLFDALTPTEPKTTQMKAKKKRLTFNNMALTAEDVMKQIKVAEDNIKEKKAKTTKRGKAKGRPKQDKVTDKNEVRKRKGKVFKCSLKKKQKTLSLNKNKTRSRPTRSVSESSTEDDDGSFVSDSSDFILSDLSLDEDDNPSMSKVKQPSPKLPESNKLPELKTGDFVAAIYEGKWFLASVFGDSPVVCGEAGHSYYHLSFAQIKGQNKFIWPEKRDDNLTLEDDILCVVNPPIPVSSRHIGLTEADYSKVKTLLYNKRQQLGCLF